MWRFRRTGAGVPAGSGKCENGDSGDIGALPGAGGFVGNRAPIGRRALLERSVSFMTPFKQAAASKSVGRGLAVGLRGRESRNSGVERADREGRES